MPRDVRLVDVDPYATDAFPRPEGDENVPSTSSSSSSRATLCSFNVGLRGLKNLCERRADATSACADQHGVRRALGYGSLDAFLRALGDVDVVCVQETKLTKLDVASVGRVEDAWDSAHSVCDAKGKDSYAGVAIYWRTSRLRPVAIEEGVCGSRRGRVDDKTASRLVFAVGEDAPFAHDFARQKELDSEGRALWVDFGTFVLCTVYVPAVFGDATMDEKVAERALFKADFLSALATRYQALIKRGRHVVLCGDWNIAPCAQRDRAGVPSSVPTSVNPSREWLHEQLDSHLTDVFRAAHPHVNHAFTCWNVASGAQLNNYGSRIDYFLMNDAFVKYVRAVGVAQSHHGSDHAPVFCSFSRDAWPMFDASQPTPALACSMLYPGRQSKVDEIFSLASGNGREPDYLAAPLRAKASASSVKAPAKRKAPPEKSIRDFFAVKNPKPPLEVSPITTQTPSTKQSPASTAKKATDQHAMSAEDARSAWSNTFAKMAPPKCRGHNEPCKIRTVKQKDNPNFGRVFFCCSRPAGPRTNRECDCGFFKWRDSRKI